MAFYQTGVGNPHKAGFGAQLFDGAAAAISHAGTQTADQLNIAQPFTESNQTGLPSNFLIAVRLYFIVFLVLTILIGMCSIWLLILSDKQPVNVLWRPVFWKICLCLHDF